MRALTIPRLSTPSWSQYWRSSALRNAISTWAGIFSYVTYLLSCSKKVYKVSPCLSVMIVFWGMLVSELILTSGRSSKIYLQPKTMVPPRTLRTIARIISFGRFQYIGSEDYCFLILISSCLTRLASIIFLMACSFLFILDHHDLISRNTICFSCHSLSQSNTT